MSLNIDHAPDTEQLSEEIRNQLFSRLKPEDIEQFYMAYQLWSQQQQITRLQLQMLALEQKITENAKCMEQFLPSAIALATLVQLQAYGVEDIDLLDRMLERGDEWLDHCLQLLQRCEQLDLIGGDYTQWCEHAMEGAYEWMDSITSTSEAEPQDTELPTARQDSTIAVEHEVTEAQLLRKLMDADDEIDETDDTIQLPALRQTPRITKPLTVADEQESTENDTKKSAAIKPTSSRITQPLTIVDEQEEDDTMQVAAIAPTRRITKPLAVANKQTETSPSIQTEISLPTQAIAETEQEHALNNIETTDAPINSENETITTYTDRASDQDGISTTDKTDEKAILSIAAESIAPKIESVDIVSPAQQEILDTAATENTIETEENATPIKDLSTFIDNISTEEEALLATLDSSETSYEQQNREDDKDLNISPFIDHFSVEEETLLATLDETSYEQQNREGDKDLNIPHPQVANEADHTIATTDDIDNTLEVASITPDHALATNTDDSNSITVDATDNIVTTISDHSPTADTDNSTPTTTTSDHSNDAMPLDGEVITTEQGRSEASSVNTPVEGNQQNGQLKDLQEYKKVEQKQGFFRWLLAKIMGN